MAYTRNDEVKGPQLMTYNDYKSQYHGAEWKDYREYLIKNSVYTGNYHDNRPDNPENLFQPSFTMKQWRSFTNEDIIMLRNHMASFDSSKRAEGYAQYLRKSWGVPLEETKPYIKETPHKAGVV